MYAPTPTPTPTLSGGFLVPYPPFPPIPSGPIPSHAISRASSEGKVSPPLPSHPISCASQGFRSHTSPCHGIPPHPMSCAPPEGSETQEKASHAMPSYAFPSPPIPSHTTPSICVSPLPFSVLLVTLRSTDCSVFLSRSLCDRVVVTYDGLYQGRNMSRDCLETALGEFKRSCTISTLMCNCYAYLWHRE